MEGTVSFGGRRDYGDFKRQVPEQVLPLFDSVREFCLSLGDSVIEDVRMHRVVFCKSMTFRWFADVEPAEDGIIIKVQRGRREPAGIIRIGKDGQVSEFGHAIRDAFEAVR